MDNLLLLAGVILICCALFQKIFRRTGVPGLFVFIALGMLFGSDGLLRIPFDNYDFAGSLCSAALVLIIYYGGLGTNLRAAKPVLGKAILLSSLGSFLTAGLVGFFAVYVLRMEMLEGMLLGAVICSTDAASVFSILRSRKMDLRYSTASLLEVESGSNDPFSYLLTVVVLSLMQGEHLSAGRIAQMLLFFMLGLLAYPSRLPSVAGPALLLALFLTFAARPAAASLLLAPFRCPPRQILFVSFAGMRGAASIAFAIMAVSRAANLSYDLFHTVFFLVLFSILVQGTLIPAAARRLDMIDAREDVMATFNDTAEDLPVQFVKFRVIKQPSFL